MTLIIYLFIFSSKPPLPPRPPGLGKVSPAKRGTNPSKSVPRRVHPKDNLNEGSSVPRRPPPPSHQTGIQNAGNEGQENKEREEECTQNEKAELSSPKITFPRVHDSTSQGNCEHDKHIESHPDDSQTEANSVSKLSQGSIEVDPSVNSNKKQGGDDEVIKLSPPENHTEPKNPAAQPSRLESLNTCTESSPSHLHSPSAAAKCETLENSVNSKTSSASHKTNSKIPERPRPPDRLPSIATEDKSNSLDSAKNSPALSETPPHVSKTPKKTPPVPPKPYSSKNSVGKQGPLIQVRTDKQPARGKTTQEIEASEIVKKSDVEKSGTLDVETPSREESRTENASLEVIVMPQTNEEVSSTPENNDVFDEEIKPSEPSNENNLPSVVSIPTEEHSKVGAAIRKEAADNVISPTTEKGSVGSEAPKREAKPRRPRAPSRKIKEITEMKISDDNLTIPDNNSSIKPELVDEKSSNVETKAADNVISPKTEKGSFESENVPKKEAKPPRPCAPSRKTEEITEVKISNDNLTTPDNTLVKPELEDEKSSNVKTKATDNVISPKTEKGSVESENEPKREAKPPRPRAPSRKTEEITEVKISNDNLTTPDNTSVKPELEDEKSSNVETKATDNVISPKTEKGSVDSENEPKREAKPPRPRAPSRKTEEITEVKISNDNLTTPDNTSVKPELEDEKSSNVETKATDNVISPKTEKGSVESENEPKREAKPPRPRAPSRKTEEITEVKISNDNLTTPDNTSVKPELEDEKSSNVETKATDNVISPKTEKGSVESENEPKREAKPPRPRAPSRKTEEITEVKISDDNSTGNTSVKPELIDEKSSNVETKDILHEPKKIENITSPKPPRPLAPVKKTAGEKTLESHDSSLSTSSEPSYPLEQHSTDAVTEHDKTEKVASPKPSRPSRPIHTPQLPKTVKGLGNQEEAKDGGWVKHKNKEKPQRPYQPQLPSERSGASIDSSSSHHESPKVKPQRPSKPNFPGEATEPKEPGSSSKNENTVTINNETSQTEASTKNAEITAANETRQDDKKQETSLSEQQEILKDKQEQKHIVSNKPSRPAKPNVETIVVQKDGKQVKEDTIESESNQSVKKTGPAKPSRPPKPSDAQNGISSNETPSSGKTEATRPRPPRPQAPQREKQVSVINVVETSAKPHERDHEKNKQTGVQTKRSVEAPPKPKRTSISSDDRSDVQLSHQEDTNQPVEILKENKEILNEAMSDEREKAVSDHHDSASTENCGRRTGEEQCEAGEHSKPFVEPPLPNKTNHVSTQNAPFIIVKRRDKGVQETSDDQKSPDRHNVKFRVSSLTKTEVESFNSKDFVEKLNDKERAKRNSAEAPAVTPPIGPKPSRPRPPSGDKHTGSGGKHEGQAEGRGDEIFEMRNEDKGEVIKNEKTSELEHVSNAEADDASCAADKVSKNDKEAPVGEIKVNECAHNDVVSSEKTDKKKVKRKAPPVPDEKQSEHVKKHSEHVKEHNELVEKHSENVEKHSEHVEKHNEHVKKHSENVEKQSEHVEERSEHVEKHTQHVEKHSENVEKRSEHVEIHSEHVDDAMSSKKIENNNEPPEEITHDAVDVTVKHQVTVNENAEGNVPEPVEDVNQACSVSESLSSCRNTSDVLTPETEVKTQKVDQDVSHEVTPSLCNEPSKQDSRQDENAGMTQGTDFVQPRKKKKAPPPKPVRTSSLKRDSKPIVLQVFCSFF